MTDREKEQVKIKMNEACDKLSEVCDEVESDYLCNEVARFRHMASSVINYKFEREGKDA